MDYRRFGFHIFLRILLIVIIGIGTGAIILFSDYWMLSIWLGILDIVLFFELYRYIKKYYSEVIQFLTSLGSREFSYSKQKHADLLQDESFQSTFLRLEKSIQSISVQKERDHILLSTVVDSIKTAFVCYDENGKIFLINKQAKELFSNNNTNHIDKLIKVFPAKLIDKIKSLKAGQKLAEKMVLNDELMYLSIESNVFILDGITYRLLTFSDIKSEMNEQEIGSYQKLTRVINHEIMNSAIPISNLTSMVNESINPENIESLSELSDEDMSDIRISLKTIESRTNGLISFIKAVKSFNSIKKTKLETVNLNELVREIGHFLKNDIEKSSIEFVVIEDEVLEIPGDKKLLEQLFINILRNAIQAVEKIENPKITVQFQQFNDNSFIRISDNGVGIDEKVINEVFVPFFTTRKEGSGIGLSICRQVMQLHKGEIDLQSKLNEGTTVQLVF